MKNKIYFLPVWLILLTSHIPGNGQGREQFSDELLTGSLEDAGFDTSKMAAITNEISKGKYNIHSLLILRSNKLVYETYFSGKDEVFPVPVGEVNHTRDSLHDCRSVSKSIVSACIGIAIAQQKIKNVNDKVFGYFPEYAKYDTGIKHTLTIKDLLTMSAGLEWNEVIPYSDPLNSEVQMFNQKDVVDFVLSRTVITKPGTVWNYSAGCTQLLAEILQKVTGEKIDTFANKYIFEPLHFKNFHWFERNDGKPWAPSGLRLRPIDMAKFGLLYLNKGKGNTQQIIPPEWVKYSLDWQINGRNPSYGYGYQFWCTIDTIRKLATKIAMAIGFGGQRIYLIPTLNLEIVITAGNYNELTDLSGELISKSVFPAIKK